MGSSRQWHDSCVAVLISTDKQQKPNAHTMFSSPPSQNKRECLELLGNLPNQMLNISLVFSPPSHLTEARMKHRLCPASQPFPFQRAVQSPCCQGWHVGLLLSCQCLVPPSDTGRFGPALQSLPRICRVCLPPVLSGTQSVYPLM